MDFRTPVELPKGLPLITHNGQILLIGSCFADNIGNLLAEYKFPVDINPYGILYNPLSISVALDEIIKKKVYTEGDIFYNNECWQSMMHHGSFSGATSYELLDKVNARIQQAHERISKISWLMLTFGTSYVYKREGSNRVVANCHKLPESSFTRSRLGVTEIVNDYTLLIAELLARNPQIKILFTVSPIRHIRDGMQANQLSKSTLLLAIDILQQRFSENVFYFPSYEIMMDDLRDYRFYAEDMVHPSSQAISYLWESFSTVFFSQETKQLNKSISEISQGLNHRPFHPESEEYKRFLEQIVLKINRLVEKYPILEFKKEKELCHIRLNS